jgi:dTDP-4-dehydrorhamnose 3,5-epimerase
MQFIPTDLKGLYSIRNEKLEDDRGFFSRTYCKKEFKQIGLDKGFVQFNISFNKHRGTIRGMHFQTMPFTETKLIRCVRGSVFDVAVDLREDSPTFLQHFGIELSEKNMLSILIPEGFAHGFQTLEDNSTLIYHHTQYYTPNADAGLRFDDPKLNINWELPPVMISPKDKSYKLLDINFKGIKL